MSCLSGPVGPQRFGDGVVYKPGPIFSPTMWGRNASNGGLPAGVESQVISCPQLSHDALAIGPTTAVTVNWLPSHFGQFTLAYPSVDASISNRNRPAASPNYRDHRADSELRPHPPTAVEFRRVHPREIGLGTSNQAELAPPRVVSIPSLAFPAHAHTERSFRLFRHPIMLQQLFHPRTLAGTGTAANGGGFCPAASRRARPIPRHSDVQSTSPTSDTR
jgi:DNA-binding transcriptional LysR family regulator